MSRYKIVNVLLFVAGPALAQLPPLEVKSIALGATIAEVKAKQPAFICQDHDAMGVGCLHRIPYPDSHECRTPRVERDCDASERDLFEFGPIRPRLYFLATGGEKVERMTVLFHERDFHALVDALIVKYGKPTSDERGAVRNRAGAEFENRKLRWSRPDGVMIVEQRSTSIDGGSLLIYGAGAVQKQADERAAKARAAAKKL